MKNETNLKTQKTQRKNPKNYYEKLKSKNNERDEL